MALSRSLNRLELATVQRTVSEALERDGLTALSQRKLNALGLPLAYIDRNQRYRFVNKALLDWFCKRADEVLGRDGIVCLFLPRGRRGLGAHARATCFPS